MFGAFYLFIVSTDAKQVYRESPWVKPWAEPKTCPGHLSSLPGRCPLQLPHSFISDPANLPSLTNSPQPGAEGAYGFRCRYLHISRVFLNLEALGWDWRRGTGESGKCHFREGKRFERHSVWEASRPGSHWLCK